MNHGEIFTEVLQNHGLSYRRYALNKGLPGNYYLISIKSKDRIKGAVFAEALGELGAEVWARSEWTDAPDKYLGGVLLKDDKQYGGTLEQYRLAMELVGWTVIVKDGDKEYRLTSGVIDGKRKTDSGPGT